MIKMKDIVNDDFEKTIQKYNKKIDRKNEIELKKELIIFEKYNNRQIYYSVTIDYCRLMRKYKDKKVVRDKLIKDIMNRFNNIKIIRDKGNIILNLTEKNLEFMDKQIKWCEKNYNENYGNFKKEKDINQIIYNYIRKNYSKLMRNFKNKEIVREKLKKDIVDNPNSHPYFNNLTEKNLEFMEKQINWWDENYIDNYGNFNNDNEVEELNNNENNNTNDNNNLPEIIF
jgi:hypothetical protein